ncbi:hypothetical protein [Gimesia chilikensis]|nr:hypothetical protein [Gimesia chilikensis]
MIKGVPINRKSRSSEFSEKSDVIQLKTITAFPLNIGDTIWCCGPAFVHCSEGMSMKNIKSFLLPVDSSKKQSGSNNDSIRSKESWNLPADIIPSRSTDLAPLKQREYSSGE